MLVDAILFVRSSFAERPVWHASLLQQKRRRVCVGGVVVPLSGGALERDLAAMLDGAVRVVLERYGSCLIFKPSDERSPSAGEPRYFSHVFLI